MQSLWGGVDYDLLDRVSLEGIKKQNSYVCPFWDWLKDFRDQWENEYWWSRIPDWPGNGMAFVTDPENPLVFCDEISGEIDVCDDCGRAGGHDSDCFYHGPY